MNILSKSIAHHFPLHEKGAELTNRHQIPVSKNIHSKILQKAKNWEVSREPTVAIQCKFGYA